MNSIKSLIAKRSDYLKYFSFSYYQKHPTYTLKTPKNRYQQLVLMRDLRLWCIENVPFSKKSRLYEAQCQQIQNEILYMDSNSK